MRRLPFVLYCALLAWGLFRPTMPPDPFVHSDKVAHLLAFTVLGLAARLAFPRAPGLWLWGLILSAAPALEALQHWLQPVRQLSAADALANTLGVLLALLLWEVCCGRPRRPAEDQA